jgi:hypothetical protein
MGARGSQRYRPKILAPLLFLAIAGAPALPAEDPGVNDFFYALAQLVPSESARNNGLTIFPILSLPFGGAQTAMGSAYTAVCRDISFLDCNPAAGAIQDETQLAANTRLAISNVQLESAGWTDRWGDYSLGALFKILHSDFTAYDATGKATATGAYVELAAGVNGSMTLWRDYNFSGLAIGANIKLAYRDIPKSFYERITRLAGSDQNAFGVMADLGLLTRFNFLKPYSSRDKNFSVGFAIRDLGPPTVQNEALPTTVNAGIAWQPLRYLTFAGDFNLPVNLVDITQSSMPGFSVGMALQIANFAGVKAGFQLKGGNPRFTVGGEVDAIEWASFLVSYTLDLSTQFRLGNHLTIQAKLNFGDNGRQALAKKVDELYISALVAMSSSDWQKVISLCEAALRIDPGFIPAREILKQAQNSQHLLDQIESIRTQMQPAAPNP